MREAREVSGLGVLHDLIEIVLVLFPAASDEDLEVCRASQRRQLQRDGGVFNLLELGSGRRADDRDVQVAERSGGATVNFQSFGRLSRNGRIGFALGDHDRQRPGGLANRERPDDRLGVALGFETRAFQDIGAIDGVRQNYLLAMAIQALVACVVVWQRTGGRQGLERLAVARVLKAAAGVRPAGQVRRLKQRRLDRAGVPTVLAVADQAAEPKRSFRPGAHSAHEVRIEDQRRLKAVGQLDGKATRGAVAAEVAWSIIILGGGMTDERRRQVGAVVHTIVQRVLPGSLRLFLSLRLIGAPRGRRDEPASQKSTGHPGQHRHRQTAPEHILRQLSTCHS